MESEVKSLSDNDIWDVVSLPSGKRAVGSKWVYKAKRGANGSIERYKTKLVAQGFTQQSGADCDETFQSCREDGVTLHAHSTVCQFGFKLHHVDVTTAFLNGDLEQEAHMKQLKGFTVEGGGDLVCKLKKRPQAVIQMLECNPQFVPQRNGFRPI